jgi:YidC/Oxa1 family membrane protein insertase
VDFLYTAVSWVLLRWHSLFNLIGLNPAGGLNWTLSIIFLVVTARLLLFRLFIKQVHYQRHMQEMQPQLQKVREKYKNDRAEMQRQMMALQQEQGFNPLAGCLPMFLQIPVFISLFHVLRHLSNSVTKCGDSTYSGGLLHLYTFNRTQTCDASQAKLFGAPLAASLHDNKHTIVDLLGGDLTSTRIVTIILVLVSAGATFVTQQMVMSRATTTPTGTAATVQKLMKVFIPISVLFSGFIFPLGVLLYWFTSNVWTLLQQAYINRYHPPEPKKDGAEVGARGKALAPKPGQRPSRDARTRPANADNGTAASASADGANGAGGADTASDGAPRSSVPRPGQRPQRPGQKRPPSKRPSQAKKRR